MTFDDGLLSQYVSAKPVLDHYNIKSFWFIYTKIFEDIYDLSEILNYFVARKYINYDMFYKEFLSSLNLSDDLWKSKEFKFFHNDLKKKFSFYSTNDIKFRYIRNNLISDEIFKEIVSDFIFKNDFDIKMIAKNLWMKKEQIRNLTAEGHEVGLHSHNHSYDIKKLSKTNQKNDYNLNYQKLSEITGKNPQVLP